MHALLSPSSASKWMNCPPSARLEETFPDSSSTYADEGTLAHKLGEYLIAHKVKHGSIISPLPIPFEISSSNYYNNEMLELMQDYSDYVVKLFITEKLKDSNTVLMQETNLDLTAYIPGGFGTVDNSIIGGNKLIVIDLKYGKGTKVSAVNNRQMNIYALGALDFLGFAFDIETVETFIYQPRIGNISNWIMSAEGLQAWGEEYLKPAAKLAFEGGGEFKTGDHCRFCKARVTCRAHAEMQLEIAKHDFKQPATLQDSEITDILTRSDSFTAWIKAVNEFALREAVAGKDWPGYKLVEGRSTRKITDEERALNRLLDAFDFETTEAFQTIKLKTITELEKSVGKKRLPEILGELIAKPPGKPTLVPESDKREKLDRHAEALKDFAAFTDSESEPD